MAVTTESTWIRRFHPADGSKVRIVCFPHAGGSASFFYPMSAALSPAADVLAVQYPGRQDRRQEPLVDDVVQLAEEICAVLRPWTDRPLVLFGHSMGASVAFEVARRLEHRFGAGPAWLLASGRTSPTRPREDAVHLLSDREVIAEVQRMSGTDSSLLQDDELVQLVLPALRNDYKAAETYRYTPGPPLSSPITALIGKDDDKVTAEQAGAWTEVTTGPFELRLFEGGHFYLSDRQDEVLDVVTRALSGVQPA